MGENSPWRFLVMLILTMVVGAAVADLTASRMWGLLAAALYLLLILALDYVAHLKSTGPRGPLDGGVV